MQNLLRHRLAGVCLLALLTMTASAQVPQAPADAAPNGGEHDFDWEFGTWNTRLRRLARPLSGSKEWVEYAGTSVVRGVLEGRANLVELRVEGPAGRIHGTSLRLYNPQTRQWNLNYASVKSGTLSHPLYGGFRGGRGEFYGQDDLDGRAILVRFVVSDVSRDSARFEQAFSEDGGRTWETNWIAVDTRVGGSAGDDQASGDQGIR